MKNLLIGLLVLGSFSTLAKSSRVTTAVILAQDTFGRDGQFKIHLFTEASNNSNFYINPIFSGSCEEVESEFECSDIKAISGEEVQLKEVYTTNNGSKIHISGLYLLEYGRTKEFSLILDQRLKNSNHWFRPN